MPKCSITQFGNDYAVKTPFNRAFVDDLKFHIAAESRVFDQESKAWIVRQDFAEMALALVEKYFSEKLSLPELKPVNQETKYNFQLDYVGTPKEREGQAGKTALGFSKGQWRIVFSEQTLKEFFEGFAEKEAQEKTLFTTLLLAETPPPTESEVKSAYRRLARQWHPDVNKEPEAEEMFKKIQNAYSILSDENKRKRYLAGLEFERASNQVPAYRSNWKPDVFIPPLRCGFLTVTGNVQVGRLKVSQILSWQDVTNEQGLTMVTSWNRDLNAIDYQWV